MMWRLCLFWMILWEKRRSSPALISNWSKCSGPIWWIPSITMNGVIRTENFRKNPCVLFWEYSRHGCFSPSRKKEFKKPVRWRLQIHIATVVHDRSVVEETMTNRYEVFCCTLTSGIDVGNDRRRVRRAYPTFLLLTKTYLNCPTR